MKKFYLSTLLTLLTIASLQAQQCLPCPQMLSVADAKGCINLDLRTQFSTAGSSYYGNADSALIKACQNSITQLSFTGLPYIDAIGGVCNYGILSIDSVSTSGGTTLGFINNNVSVQWGNVSSGTIYISFSIQPANSTSAPCKNAIILKFNLINPPVASFVASPQPACFSNPTPIFFNASATTNATNYFWNFGDGFTSTAMNPTHNYTAAGTYTVCLYVNNSVHGSQGTAPSDCVGCVDTFCNTITIDPLPPPDITCITTICNSTTRKYCTSCTSYNWSVIGGTIASGAGTNCITVNWGSGVPQGTISLNVAGCTTPFCTNSNVITVPIIPTTGNIIGNNLVCLNANTGYSLPAFPGATYSWSVSGGGNITSNNTNTNSIVVFWNTSGVYTVSAAYSNAELGCAGTANYVVTVAPNLSILGANNACVFSTTNYNASLDVPYIPANCTWSIAPAATIVSGQSTPNISITWPAIGTYTITASTIGAPTACGSVQYVVNVTPIPVVTDIVGPINICANGSNNYYATSTINAGFFNWVVTGGTFTPSGMMQDSISVTWANAGPYSIDVFQTLLNGCTSANYTESFTAGVLPNITGTTSVCADDTATYTITNIASGNFNWYITPAQYGTVYTGQGTNTAQIIWSGNNNPGATNTVYLHFGICNTDSIAINITDPAPINITASGSLCNGAGVSLTTGIGSGTIAWSSTNIITPTQSLTTNSLSNLNTPALYTINVINLNNTGCNATGTINIADVGRPVGQISANNILVYCTSNLPNMTLSALTGIGYTYQWYLNNALVGTSSTLAVNSSAPCNINAAGTYVFYEVASLNNCTDTSNIITVTVLTCAGGSPGTFVTCPGVSIVINNVAGCNPFVVNATATGPIGSNQIPASQTILHYIDGSIVSGTNTNTFTTVGYQLLRICKNVLLADNVTVCTGCKDTSVLITVAADFVASENCGVVSFINNSTAYAPTTITNYSWSLTDALGNPVPPVVGSYNNNAIATPILTLQQSGTFIISLTITGNNGCTAIHKDTISVSLPDANFSIATSCVGTPVNFANVAPTTTNYWNFGDATSSYVSPTQHTYAVANSYNVTHAVSDAAGCVDTVINALTILPKPICTITVGGANPFCSNDSLLLGACLGYTNYQWYKNGIAIAGATSATYYVHFAGNYYCTANTLIGCNVMSDTINATILQAPNANITQTGLGCVGSGVSFSVSSCLFCNFLWQKDYVVLPSTSNIISGAAGGLALPIGTHTITVSVTDFTTGCSSVDTVFITVNQIPTITVNVYGVPSTPTFCSNNLYTMEGISNAASPAWLWTYASQTFSTNDSILASSEGFYNVIVTNGITGCTNSSLILIDASPDLSLFPIGCDTLCDTSTIAILAPIPSVNNFLGGYTIDWYDNAPPFTLPIYTGIALPNSLLAVGPHQLSVIVTSPNGCVDTSTVYELYTKSCTPAPLSIMPLQLFGKMLNEVAVLQWKTFGYEATNRFEIQISEDGISFKTKYILAKDNMAQNEMMNLVKDELKNTNKNYFRIMQVYNNNTSKYSNIIQLQITNNGVENMVALPNITAGNVEIIMQSLEAFTTNIVVTNSIGAQVYKLPIALQKGINNCKLQLHTLPAGLYYASIATKYGKHVVKMIKE
jgi:PKD repeat protein